MSTTIIIEKLDKLAKDVELIKDMLIDDDGELTEWAKSQLELARKTPRSQYIPHEEVKKRILGKK